MKYLIDTNVLILGVKGHEPDASFLRKTTQSDRVNIFVVSIAEFFAVPQGLKEGRLKNCC